MDCSSTIVVKTCKIAKIKSNLFITEGCLPHHCDKVNYIIIYNFEQNNFIVGTTENGRYETYSENGLECAELKDWKIFNEL